MPMYQFKDAKTGEVVELQMPMAEAVPVGDEIERDGRRLVRLASEVHTHESGEYPYVSNRLPRWMGGAKHTREGKPIIESRRHEVEFSAQHGLKRD